MPPCPWWRKPGVGVLNVASHESAAFTVEMLELLGGIGRQLGVAIENARLWEELRRKEELRGQLLRKVITAQEEERKRIGRELHDETSQSLAALVVVLQAAQPALSLGLEKCAERIDDAKTAVTRLCRNCTRSFMTCALPCWTTWALPALRWCAQNRLEQRGVRWLGHCRRGELTPPEVETALSYRPGGQRPTSRPARHRRRGTGAGGLHPPVSPCRSATMAWALTRPARGSGWQTGTCSLRPAARPSHRRRRRPAGLGLAGMEERDRPPGRHSSIQSAPARAPRLKFHPAGVNQPPEDTTRV